MDGKGESNAAIFKSLRAFLVELQTILNYSFLYKYAKSNAAIFRSLRAFLVELQPILNYLKVSAIRNQNKDLTDDAASD